jgi:8-oxo-dGTP pyrophosphatase MutT (NUDIX family)
LSEANAGWVPVPIRDAASVLLLRDDPAGGAPEVWMLTRVSQMIFAPGASVFPGGRVDDDDASLPWSGRPAAEFAVQFDCPVDEAHALVGAAVRETFEETGVLLTQPAASLAHLQPEVEDGHLIFGELLTRHGLSIDGCAVLAWARWVTPDTPETQRRYDTRFFVALLPAGSQAADLTRESSTAGWTTAAEALASWQRGERQLVGPTVAMLASIVDCRTVDEIVARAPERSLRAVRH